MKNTEIKQERLPKEGSGWYFAAPARKYHWFDEKGIPACGSTIKGMNLYIEPISKLPEDQQEPNKYFGYCTTCMKKISSASAKK